MSRPKNDYNLQILQAIESGKPLTQRSLASSMGVALGLTNLLIRRLAAKGYVKVSHLGTRHVRYLMTTAGREALARATRQSLENTVHLYTETREHIRGSLAVLSDRVEADDHGQKRIVFYGAGDVAEIAYVSLQSTDLTLVGVVDDRRTGRFFEVTICPSDRLSADTLDTIPYGHVVVTSLRHADTIRARIEGRGVRPERVSCL